LGARLGQGHFGSNHKITSKYKQGPRGQPAEGLLGDLTMLFGGKLEKRFSDESEQVIL